MTGSFILTALIVASVIGGATMAYLWAIKRKQLVVAGGIATLAGMRWREFSRFVIEALQQQGFEASPTEGGVEQTDLRLIRNGQLWLLSCKQGANYRITGPQVRELADAVRLNGAAGGLLATLGTVDPSARKAGQGIELLDGQALWPLIDPLLPPSVHNGLMDKANKSVARAVGFGWAVAIVLGLGVAAVVGSGSDANGTAAPLAMTPAQPTPARTPATAPLATARPSAASAATAALGEDEQRKDVLDRVSALPGVASASWSTRSTLQVQLSEDADQRRVDEICAALKRHADVRTSRLHLQPPPGSEARVRFLQCATF